MKRRVSRVSRVSLKKTLLSFEKKNLVGSFKKKINNNEKRYDR